MNTAYFTINGQPIPKPRQTRSDKWKQRPCVMAYRAFADRARLAAVGRINFEIQRMTVIAFLPIPKSYSKRKAAQLAGKPHTLKPDADNILKAVADALLENDQGVYRMAITKLWDDGLGARLVVRVCGVTQEVTR